MTFIVTAFLLITVVTVFASYVMIKNKTNLDSYAQQVTTLQSNSTQLQDELTQLQTNIASTEAELQQVLAEDQRVRNDELEKEIADIQKTYKETVKMYDQLLDVKEATTKTQELDATFAKILTLLGNRNYASASASLTTLRTDIQKKQAELATLTATITAPVNNSAPSSGSSRQTVESDAGAFVVDLIAADLNSTRVLAVTASDGNCGDNCPVSSLADFVGKGGGYAGINGPYFCPAEYPSCAGKTNSFDTLLMNNKKTYFNSDNNVYSTVPAVIFSGNSARFVGQSLEWGRDTGVDSVIASQPLLLSNGEVRFGGDGDPKKGSRGSRSFIGTKGNTVYIGVVRNATVAEVARVLKALGLDHALNLDSGGSTALMLNGKYLAGPGRNTPFGIVLARK